MTKLQRAALRVLPMTETQVNAIYQYPGQMEDQETIRLCLSHERLRAELAGAEIIIKELEAKCHEKS